MIKQPLATQPAPRQLRAAPGDQEDKRQAKRVAAVAPPPRLFGEGTVREVYIVSLLSRDEDKSVLTYPLLFNRQCL
jgi:hypothetical protein